MLKLICNNNNQFCYDELVGLHTEVPWSNAFWLGLTPFGPPMWQAEADTELTLSASPTTAVGQKALALAKRRYSTVLIFFFSREIIAASNASKSQQTGRADDTGHGQRPRRGSLKPTATSSFELTAAKTSTTASTCKTEDIHAICRLSSSSEM